MMLSVVGSHRRFSSFCTQTTLSTKETARVERVFYVEKHRRRDAHARKP